MKTKDNKKNIQIGVAGIILDSNNKVFIAKTPKLQNNFTIPGGHVEFGENLVEALKREILEETGLNVCVSDMIGFYQFINKKKKFHIISFHFLCRLENKNEKVSLDERELFDFSWVDLDSAISLVFLEDFKQSLRLIKKYD